MKLFKINQLLFLSFLFFISCNSIKHYNRKFDEKIQPDKLKSDVDYIHSKLVKLHPKLYYYISEKDLNYKFDSLKNTINLTITRTEFYFKISPIISSIKQGHAHVDIPFRRLEKAEKNIIKSTKLLTPISDLEVEFFNDKLYIVKNESADSTIKIGSEIISIDSVKPFELYQKYYNTFSSDGFNTTFKKSVLNKRILAYYFIEYGYKDSIQVKLNLNGDTLTKSIKRSTYKSKPTQKLANRNKLDSKNCHLSFVGKDSNIALLKVDNFMSLNYDKFFRKIDSVGSTKLIIDLRGNPGGAAYSCKKLFSYLIDTTYHFFHPYEVTSRTSILHTRKFREKGIVGKLFHIAFLPFQFLKHSIRLLSVKKIDNRYFYYEIINGLKAVPEKKYCFKNKIYVIIDGGTFSAACIFSSNLKGYNLATFVGEETGGDFNGACAGYMPTFTLPHSNLKISFGLLYVKASCISENYGHGIMPDVGIIPTLEDRVNKKDPELDWILNDIKQNSNNNLNP